ncbi:hypothetical protein SI65_02267 [Aspergillus cristatus]|uniref:MULE transposase domain-containing protein n=1 Tax=Aspergillus cristatus TaxID=573508 RepID=A0A1E3BKA8_ASPCR|nr:hypothetical protein SI65_02267 [Aspergillus cristatus]
MDVDHSTIDMNELTGLDLDAEADIEEPAIPIPLTSAKGPGLTTLKIEYNDDLPEYPTSHFDGYSYVVASRGRSQLEMEQLAHDIQYAKRLQYGQKRPVYCPFFRCHVKKWTWKCSGIYACEFLNSFLQSCHHTFVDDIIWQEIQKSQKDIQLLESDLGKRNAYSYYRSKVAFFEKGLACIEQLPSCKPVFKRYSQMNVHGEYDPYIGCINESYGVLTKHHRGAIQGHTVINLQFLEDLFNKEIIPATEECGVFESLSSRRKYCGRDHPQGSGRLQHTPCDVVFNALVPVDIGQCPYILFTSHGVHKHPPPPPTKAPERILQGVKRIIQQIRDPSLTTAQFLRNPQLEAFCQQHNASTLTEIHSSFCNKDRIAAIIQKQRLLSYPSGQDVNGLIFLENTDQHIKDYIQEQYHDSQDTMILCGFKKQIELLSQLSSFEVDMSYKRIRSKNMNEVLFATFLPDQCKVITLLRVFTTVDSTEGYYLLFKRAFDLVQKITGHPVLFDSIHGTGVHGIIVDMDSKQYTGLGKYLSEIDPQNHDVTWHLQHIIIFCRVHFQRSILNTIGTRNQGSPLWSRMMSLLDCKSEADYDALVELLIKFEDANVQTWAIQKKSPVIKAGLNKACSKIQSHYFAALRNHTNAVEQSHQKSYASGKYLTLTEAVKNSAKLDKDDILQYDNFRKFNIHHSYRTSNMEANYLRHMSRESKCP